MWLTVFINAMLPTDDGEKKKKEPCQEQVLSHCKAVFTRAFA